MEGSLSLITSGLLHYVELVFSPSQTVAWPIGSYKCEDEAIYSGMMFIHISYKLHENPRLGLKAILCVWAVGGWERRAHWHFGASSIYFRVKSAKRANRQFDSNVN
jgi:hypothetical protein